MVKDKNIISLKKKLGGGGGLGRKKKDKLYPRLEFPYSTLSHQDQNLILVGTI